jgi:hypothetical protein
MQKMAVTVTLHLLVLAFLYDVKTTRNNHVYVTLPKKDTENTSTVAITAIFVSNFSNVNENFMQFNLAKYDARVIPVLQRLLQKYSSSPPSYFITRSYIAPDKLLTI